METDAPYWENPTLSKEGEPIGFILETTHDGEAKLRAEQLEQLGEYDIDEDDTLMDVDVDFSDWALKNLIEPWFPTAAPVKPTIFKTFVNESVAAPIVTLRLAKSSPILTRILKYKPFVTTTRSPNWFQAAYPSQNSSATTPQQIAWKILNFPQPSSLTDNFNDHIGRFSSPRGGSNWLKYDSALTARKYYNYVNKSLYDFIDPLLPSKSWSYEVKGGGGIYGTLPEANESPQTERGNLKPQIITLSTFPVSFDGYQHLANCFIKRLASTACKYQLVQSLQLYAGKLGLWMDSNQFARPAGEKTNFDDPFQRLEFFKTLNAWEHLDLDYVHVQQSDNGKAVMDSMAPTHIFKQALGDREISVDLGSTVLDKVWRWESLLEESNMNGDQYRKITPQEIQVYFQLNVLDVSSILEFSPRAIFCRKFRGKNDFLFYFTSHLCVLDQMLFSHSSYTTALKENESMVFSTLALAQIALSRSTPVAPNSPPTSTISSAPTPLPSIQPPSASPFRRSAVSIRPSSTPPVGKFSSSSQSAVPIHPSTAPPTRSASPTLPTLTAPTPTHPTLITHQQINLLNAHRNLIIRNSTHLSLFHREFDAFPPGTISMNKGIGYIAALTSLSHWEHNNYPILAVNQSRVLQRKCSEILGISVEELLSYIPSRCITSTFPGSIITDVLSYLAMRTVYHRCYVEKEVEKRGGNIGHLTQLEQETYREGYTETWARNLMNKYDLAPFEARSNHRFRIAVKKIQAKVNNEKLDRRNNGESNIEYLKRSYRFHESHTSKWMWTRHSYGLDINPNTYSLRLRFGFHLTIQKNGKFKHNCNNQYEYFTNACSSGEICEECKVAGRSACYTDYFDALSDGSIKRVVGEREMMLLLLDLEEFLEKKGDEGRLKKVEEIMKSLAEEADLEDV